MGSNPICAIRPRSESLGLFSLQRCYVGKKVKRAIYLALELLFLIFFVPGNSLTPQMVKDRKLEMIVDGWHFALTRWEVSAIYEKLETAVERPQKHLTPEESRRLVVEYVQTAQKIGQLEGEITKDYALGDSKSLEKARELQAEVSRLRAVQARRRPTVEAILQRMISDTMESEHLGMFGRVFPPVEFHFTETPKYLVISPRNKIEMIKGITLKPDIPVSVQDKMERTIHDTLDWSALVDGLGGFSLYPTMVTDQADLNWIMSTIAHEWTHNYMAFHPLGWHYYDNQDMHTINETVADIVGNEIGRKTMKKYFPQLLPPPPSPFPPPPSPRPKFDFNREMRKTYLHVVELLKANKIDEAERYMEERRRVFVAHGYYIRKLNQAYFAFHGSYAAGPGAISPIGPKLQELWALSPSLAFFVHTVQGFKNPKDLDRALQKLRRREEARNGARTGYACGASPAASAYAR